MTPVNIVQQRLENQDLARTCFHLPEEVVAWFGAVQAQDYLGSLWALGQRMRGATEAGVEAAESRRAIVRTWPMRGTLHFVAAADVRWMTQLLAPRVLARNAARIKREVGVDAAVVARCREVLARELEGGRRLERGALYQALEARRIRTDNSRGLHILGWLAMEGTLCLAGRSGKQHTFALLDEWIPQTPRLAREAALAELAARYFTSHGPATLPDFMWWAGITVKDARAAVDAARPRLASEIIGQREYYWSARSRKRFHGTASPRVKLLPAFDEYTVAYEDRSLLLADAKKMDGMGLLGNVVVADGIVIGNWKRSLARDGVQVTAKLLRPMTLAEGESLAESARKLGGFLGLPVNLDISAPRAPRGRLAGVRPASRRGAQ
jgi:hypothetical protein